MLRLRSRTIPRVRWTQRLFPHRTFTIKAFLTRTADRYRPPYERYVITVPRQCVFAGSVNPDTYLRDETGNRRFWPVRCGEIDLDGLRRDRDRLWAEAVVRFNAGAPWWLEDKELIALAAAAQEARYQGDAWDALIERWLTACSVWSSRKCEPMRDPWLRQALINEATKRWGAGSHRASAMGSRPRGGRHGA
jgi:predicted P-loop ATPase